MNRTLEQRISRLEETIGISENADSRKYIDLSRVSIHKFYAKLMPFLNNWWGTVGLEYDKRLFLKLLKKVEVNADEDSNIIDSIKLLKGITRSFVKQGLVRPGFVNKVPYIDKLV